MKTDIKVSKTLAIIGVTVALITSLSMNAQKYTVKAYGDIGFGGAMSLTTDLSGMTADPSPSNSFGVDFGYTFWQKNASSLEVNVGVGYRMLSSKFNLYDFNYNYTAPATADEDGNSYQRFTSLSNLEQKIDMGYINIPIYLQYQYRLAKWIGIKANFGFEFGFKCSGKVASTKGRAKSYGVYPEYDDLMIDADYLNAFGETALNDAITGNPNIKSFSASLVGGVGCEFYIGGPVSIDVGVNYHAGLTKVFEPQYSIDAISMINSESAPVTYTVLQGQHVKALSDYVTKSNLNNFSLHLGVNLRF